MAKFIKTVYRAVNSALAHESTRICAVLDAAVEEVPDAAILFRWEILGFTPGSGTRGFEQPIDPHLVLWQSSAHGFQLPVLAQAMKSNKRCPCLVVERCAQVLIIGLSNYSDTADLSNSPGLENISLLISAGAHVGFPDHHFAGPVTLEDTYVLGYPNARDFCTDGILLSTAYSHAGPA